MGVGELMQTELAWDDLIEVMRQWENLMEKYSEKTCGPTREDHDVAYCIDCEGGFCLRCGRADNWGVRCIHRPAWRHDH